MAAKGRAHLAKPQRHPPTEWEAEAAEVIRALADEADEMAAAIEEELKR